MSYITESRNHWPVALLCRTLGVSESAYYKFLRSQSKPDKHGNLLAQIYELIQEDEENANYEVRRIYDYLRLNQNYYGSLRTIYRICKENNLMIRRQRKPNGMILHSNCCTQFTSQRFRNVLKNVNAIQSMSGTSRCYDNARMESFFCNTE